MGFMDKLRANISRFMSGRYGVDQMGNEMVTLAVVMTVAGALLNVTILNTLSLALMLLSLFRIFSKNRYKRAQENQDYLAKTMKLRRGTTEWINRVKNHKKYRYYSCPKCKMRLRVPRGVGNVTITCKGCGEKFDKKA